MNKRFIELRYELKREIAARILLIILALFFVGLSILGLSTGAKVTDTYFIMPTLFFLLLYIGIIIQNRRIYSFCLLDEDGMYVYEFSLKKGVFFRWEDFKYAHHHKASKQVFLLLSTRPISDKEAHKAGMRATFLNKYMPMDGVVAIFKYTDEFFTPSIMEAYGMINRKLGHLMGLGEDTGEPEIEATEEFEDTPE